ncbi:MAG: Uncharacterized protein FD129_600 [bacterium]|nr:MAG: Uncharacterized protein FD129_600 [bacterium]
MPTHDRSELLDAIEQRLHDLERRRRRLELGQLVSGADDGEADAALDAEEAIILGEPGYAGLMVAEDDGSDRRLSLHRRRWPVGLVQTDADVSRLTRELDARISAFEPWAGDQPVSRARVAELLRTEPDRSQREAAWFASLPLAASLETDLQRLMSQRNHRARALGFDDYPEMALPMDESSKLTFLTLGDEIEPLTRPTFEEMLAWMRGQNGGATLEPWDIDYYLARLEPPVESFSGDDTERRLMDLTGSLGLDPAELGIVRHDAGAGSARTIVVSAPDDIHCFLTRRDGAPALQENLAAWGRALHAAHRPAAVTWTSGGFNEAMAWLMVELGGRSAADATWRSWCSVWAVRRTLASSLFELLAYESPEADLHGLWCEIHEHYLGFPRHPERLWAVGEGYVSSPLSGANLLVGRLIGAQLAETLVGKAGADRTTSLRAIWESDARETTEELVLRLTGRIPDPDAWVRTLGVEIPG